MRKLIFTHAGNWPAQYGAAELESRHRLQAYGNAPTFTNRTISTDVIHVDEVTVHRPSVSGQCDDIKKVVDGKCRAGCNPACDFSDHRRTFHRSVFLPRESGAEWSERRTRCPGLHRQRLRDSWTRFSVRAGVSRSKGALAHADRSGFSSERTLQRPRSGSRIAATTDWDRWRNSRSSSNMESTDPTDCTSARNRSGRLPRFAADRPRFERSEP